MARLPIPGGDKGNWGTILNDFLTQSHKSDGKLKDDSVGAAQLQDNAVTASAIAPNAITVTELAGDSVDTTVIADGSITSAKIADGTIVTGDISPAAGIVKSQLSSSVQASLDKADTALQSGTSVSSISGFPLRLPGEKAVAVAQEVAVARAEVSNPAGHKVVVLAETWGKPGILKHIWVAVDNSATVDGFLEQGGVIRVYTDDDTTPAISMSLGDFFCLANRSDVFETPRVGRSNRGSGGSAYRYLHMPFQKYLRVEIESLMGTDSAFYGTADYSLVDSFSDLGTQQLAYSIKGQRVASQAVQTPMTVCDFDGSGQIESLVVSFAGADNGDWGVLEGDIQVYVDGEQFPIWSSSGMEDAFNGGWYATPIGGYPAGRSGDSDQSGVNMTMYRFFLDDPIFYSSHLKVVAWAGQPGQGGIVSATVDFAGYVGVWSSAATTPSYTAVDGISPPVLNDQMDQTAGALDSGTWNQDGTRTQMVATGSTFTVPYGSASADQDVRAARKNVSLPSDYWLETKVRITDPSHDNQEALLVMLGATPDPYFGSAVHIGLRRYEQYNWHIQLRDDFDTPFDVTIGGGLDLTNMWARLALKKQGSKITGYYSLNDTPSPWIPLGTWDASKVGTGFGIATWTAGAEFDYLVVRPLEDVTS
ncbi:MAG: DUF2961 domain-containing protein [Candidatus Nomurabacteria bacterium]|nr:MAG: DUF2961 domain-containing protein [Candidatus Nomurabacteria bacterium]